MSGGRDNMQEEAATAEKKPTRHIVILGERFRFPCGMASSSRVRLLARGLVESGMKATVMPTRSIDPWRQPANTEPRGVVDGVAFEYSSGNPVRSRHFLMRRWQDLRGTLGAMLRLWRMRRAGRLDLVILYTLDIATVRWATFCCRRLGVPAVQELCEWPLDLVVGHEDDRRAVARATAFCRDALGMADAVLPISRAVEDHVVAYGERTGRSIPTLSIPILVDAELFAGPAPASDTVYSVCSTALIYRRIVQMVVDSCRELKARSIACEFRFTGGATEEEEVFLRSCAEEAGVGDRIRFLGFVSTEELTRQYKGAAFLIVPLPDDAESRTRFPTKLGEYLACERPVVTTRIGEMERRLKDGVTAFLARECTASALADSIEEALSDPGRAAAVARRGRELAETQFHYAAQGRRLAAFLEELIERGAGSEGA